MPAITTERTIGKTKRAVLGGLIRYNDEKLGKQQYRRLAISLRDKGAVVGGIVGEIWMTVLFIQLFWIEERFRGKGHGTALMDKDRGGGAAVWRRAVLSLHHEYPGSRILPRMRL